MVSRKNFQRASIYLVADTAEIPKRAISSIRSSTIQGRSRETSRAADSRLIPASERIYRVPLSYSLSLSLAFGLFRFLSKGESFSDLGKRENSAPVLTRIHCELPFRGYIRTPSFDLPSIVRRPFPTLIFAPLRPLRRGFVNLLPRVLANLGNTRGGWQGKEPLEPKLQKTRAERNSS